jgi:hypothetical protein
MCHRGTQCDVRGLEGNDVLRCENRSVNRVASRKTGLEMTDIPVQTGYGWKSLKVFLINSNFRCLLRPIHIVTCQESFLTPIFLISTKICLLERHLSDNTGPKGRGRVDGVGDEGNGGNCTWNTGWNTGALFLSRKGHEKWNAKTRVSRVGFSLVWQIYHDWFIIVFQSHKALLFGQKVGPKKKISLGSRPNWSDCYCTDFTNGASLSSTDIQTFRQEISLCYQP